MLGEKVWTLKHRKDGCPVANVYHFSARRVERIVPIKVTIPNKTKACLTQVNGSSAILWRVSSAYQSAHEWLIEADTSGEVVLWVPGTALVEAWLFARHIPVYICFNWEAFAIVRPEVVYFPVDADTDLDGVSEFVKKYDPLVQLASVAFVNGRTFSVVAPVVTSLGLEPVVPEKVKRKRKYWKPRKPKKVNFVIKNLHLNGHSTRQRKSNTPGPEAWVSENREDSLRQDRNGHESA